VSSTDQPKRRGRPPTGDETMDAGVLVRISRADRDKARQAAEALGTTLDAEARKAWARLVRLAAR